jgi:hypothetical protein
MDRQDAAPHHPPFNGDRVLDLQVFFIWTVILGREAPRLALGEVIR